jgi:DNA processing protein
MNACHPCLRRMWLLERMAAHLERQRARVDRVLALADAELIALMGGDHAAQLIAEHAGFGHAAARRQLERSAGAGLELICRHAEEYPAQLRALEAPPAVLSVNGGVQRLVELCSVEVVAIVGTRKATRYGQLAATQMARDLAGAGVTVVSGMAFGIDSAAHEGALDASGRTVAVLAGAAHRAYPVRKSGLHHRLLHTGVVISELGPEMSTWRWALQARNRIIAGLAAATVLIEAPQRSGALITIKHADRLERWIGALPGPVGVPQSAGPNRLLAKARAGRDPVGSGRVRAVRNAQDVLDLLYGEGIIDVPEPLKPAPTPSESALLARIDNEVKNIAMLEPSALVELTALELKGWVTRGAGGALTVVRT